MQQQKPVNPKMNIVTKEGWNLVRKAFAELPDGRRRCYEDESVARGVRKGDCHAKGRRGAEQVGDQPGPPSQLAVQAVPAEPASRAGHDEGSQHLHMQDLRFSSLALPSKAGAFKSFADCTDFVPEDLPLHPDVLHHYVNG